MKILIVDDEEMIRGVIREYVEFEGNEAYEAADGMEAVKKCRENDYDLVLMDVMMPHLDGFSAVKEIRKSKDVPVIMLSARGEEYDKLFAFEIGVDDYVTKPFSPAELTARLDALVRRIRGDSVAVSELLTQGPFVMNTRNRTLEKNGNRIRLTQVEYAIVKLFMQNPGRALSREEILSVVWGREYEGDLKIVDVNIRRLRIKLEDNPNLPVFVTTVWGYGYKWGS